MVMYVIQYYKIIILIPQNFNINIDYLEYEPALKINRICLNPIEEHRSVESKKRYIDYPNINTWS